MLEHQTVSQYHKPAISLRRNLPVALAIALLLSLLVTAPVLAGAAASTKLTVTEEPSCNYAIDPTSFFYAETGGQGLINVAAPTGCSWTVVNNLRWINLASAGSGSGNDAVTFEVKENTTGTARQGTFTIAGLSFTVVQDAGLASECGFSLSSTFKSLPASGGTGILSVNVLAADRCAWQTLSDPDWITVTSGNVGIGNGMVTYSVGANTTGLSRIGTITAAGVTFTVKQKAS